MSNIIEVDFTQRVDIKVFEDCEYTLKIQWLKRMVDEFDVNSIAHRIIIDDALVSISNAMDEVE